VRRGSIGRINSLDQKELCCGCLLGDGTYPSLGGAQRVTRTIFARGVLLPLIREDLLVTRLRLCRTFKVYRQLHRRTMPNGGGVSSLLQATLVGTSLARSDIVRAHLLGTFTSILVGCPTTSGLSVEPFLTVRALTPPLVVQRQCLGLLTLCPLTRD